MKSFFEMEMMKKIRERRAGQGGGLTEGGMKDYEIFDCGG